MNHNITDLGILAESELRGIGIMRVLLIEEARRRDAGRTDHAIPFRPDHGHEILSDIGRDLVPGYPLIGRMRGLAELRSIVSALALAPPTNTSSTAMKL